MTSPESAAAILGVQLQTIIQADAQTANQLVLTAFEKRVSVFRPDRLVDATAEEVRHARDEYSRSAGARDVLIQHILEHASGKSRGRALKAPDSSASADPTFPNPIVRVVDFIHEPAGWAVRTGVGQPSLSVHTDRPAAELYALIDCAESNAGGDVWVFDEDGKLADTLTRRPNSEDQRRPADDTEDPDSQDETDTGAAEEITEDPVIEVADTIAKHSMTGLDWFITIGLLVAPALLSSLISPEILASDRSIVGVFFATFAFSAGIALAVFIGILLGDEAELWQFGALGVLCLVLTTFLAWVFGFTTYNWEWLAEGMPKSLPLVIAWVPWLFKFIWGALLIYGPIGAILGAGAGAYAGIRAGRYVSGSGTR
jgi:hypothetical protein